MRYIFTILFALFISLPASAQDIPDMVQASYEDLTSFEAGFVQHLTNAASGETEERKGRIWFKQPSLVRWETINPEPELLIVGKEAVWNYFENEELAIKYRANQLFNSKTMIKFLSGKANLKEDFQVEDQGDDRGLAKLRLVPFEPETGMVLAYIWVDRKSGLLQQVLIVDFYGNGNMVTLSEVELNEGADDAIFEFTPPKGVDVEDNTVGTMP